ncbi:MAG: hypothetical protein K9M07_02325 [Simkaniaceae bacterium]|nr:hypothetical protein [Simkaniaceae bacterium]
MLQLIFIAIYIIIAIILTIKHIQNRRPKHFIERLIAHFYLWCVGCIAMLGFISHAFFPDWTAQYIGWKAGGFQTEIAIGNLAISIAGFIAFFKGQEFRWGALVPYFIFFVGAGINHIVQIIVHHNMAPGNAGVVLYTDIILPIYLLLIMICHSRIKEKKTRKR